MTNKIKNTIILNIKVLIFALLLIRICSFLCLMSVSLGCPLPSFFQFVMAVISLCGLINNLKKYDMGNNILLWVGANMGRPKHYIESDKQ